MQCISNVHSENTALHMQKKANKQITPLSYVQFWNHTPYAVRVYDCMPLAKTV